MNRPPIPEPPYEGGCLCGQVRYRLAARPLAVNACHCNDCKKLSGSTHIVTVVADRTAFAFDGAVERWRKRADSGREVDILRCAACGTRLWHEPLAAPNLVILAGGTFDDSSWLVPACHIWVDRLSPGVAIPGDVLAVAGQSDRQTQIDAFTKLYGELP